MRNLLLSLLILCLLPFSSKAGSRAHITILSQDPLLGPYEITVKHKYTAPKVTYIQEKNIYTGEQEWFWCMADTCGASTAADGADDFEFIQDWLGPKYCNMDFAIYDKACRKGPQDCTWYFKFYDNHLKYLTINHVDV